MTAINISLKIPGSGAVYGARGYVEFQPTARYSPTWLPSSEVLPTPFTVVLDESGEAQINIEQTTPAFAWRVTEYVEGGERYYIEVPAATPTPVNLNDLTRVDPATLTGEAQVAAWSDLQDQMDTLQTTVDNITPLTINNEAPVAGNFSISATDVGAVPSTGGTITGPVTITATTTINDLLVTGKLDGHKVVTVRNNTGAPLTKGTVVYISGAAGANVYVSKAIATGDATSANTMGIVYADIAHGADGQILTEGYIEGINTGTAIAGDPAFLSATTAGGIVYGLANKPQAPNHLVYVGMVARAGTTNGRLFVKIQNGYELEELHNVRIINPQHGQVLTYDAISGLWKNVNPI